MGITKKIDLSNIFILLFLAIFPFGQIFHLGFNLFGVQVSPQPLDVIAGCGAFYVILTKMEKPKVFKYLFSFILFSIFSFTLSIFIFKSLTVFIGFLYLIRLIGYTYFFVYVWNFAKKKSGNSKLLVDSILCVSLVSVFFGWFQFFVFPSIKPLFSLNWDMHTFRLVGTFLDPGFLGLIIVFGLLLSIDRYVVGRSWKYVLISIFLLISLAFTYSRASYLAFLAGVTVIGIYERKLKYVLCLALALTFLIFILPTSQNHSIEFSRTFSAVARLGNYKETILIVKKFPVFGVGYNNLCLARNMFIGRESYFSHSCSGSDSSILFILATTGVIGFIILVYGISHMVYKSKGGVYYSLFISSSIALLIHSLFSNSMFYPWIMGYMVILLSINLTD